MENRPAVQAAPYQQLQETLKKMILEGRYQDGDFLPSENQLAREHGITRMTVRKALNSLVHQGYIEKQQGKGSRVSPRRKSLRLLSFHGFSDVLRGTKKTVSTKMIASPAESDWPQPFFYPLSPGEIEAGCIALIRIRQVDSVPVMLEKTWLPNMALQALCQKPLIEGSLFATLNRQFHIDVTGMIQDVRAIASARETARLLQLTAGEPILHIDRRYKTNRQGFYLYSSLFCNTRQYAISSQFD